MLIWKNGVRTSLELIPRPGIALSRAGDRGRETWARGSPRAARPAGLCCSAMEHIVTIFTPFFDPADDDSQPMNGKINEHMKSRTDLGWELVSTDVHWPTSV